MGRSDDRLASVQNLPSRSKSQPFTATHAHGGRVTQLVRQTSHPASLPHRPDQHFPEPPARCSLVQDRALDSSARTRLQPPRSLRIIPHLLPTERILVLVGCGAGAQVHRCAWRLIRFPRYIVPHPMHRVHGGKPGRGRPMVREFHSSKRCKRSVYKGDSADS